MARVLGRRRQRSSLVGASDCSREADKTEQAQDMPLEEIPDPRPSPAEEAETREQLELHFKANKLTDKQAERLKSWFIDGEPLTSIAEREGMGFPTVKSSVRGALRKLGLDYKTAKRLRDER